MQEPILLTTYEGDLLLGSVVATEEFDDIALIKLESPTSLRGLSLSTDRPNPGDPVFYVGHPASIDDWITGVGVVTEYQPYFESFVNTTLPTSPGASGSPMFNMNGEVVALISGCMNFDDEEDARLKGTGEILYSLDPQPPISDSCGGTEISEVMKFVNRNTP